MRRMLWRLLAATALGLGALGVALPGLPTVPFLILAAWAGGHGWPELEQRLLEHPHYGPSIHAWRTSRAIPRKAKWLATVFIGISLGMLFVLPAPNILRWLLPPFLAIVLLWLWRRPEA